jgi:hypothetical protein
MRAGAPQPPADIESVDPRQHHVEHDGIVLGDRGLIKRVSTVPRHVHGVRLLTQPFREHLRGAGLIFDQQHSHSVHSPNRTRSRHPHGARGWVAATAAAPNGPDHAPDQMNGG